MRSRALTILLIGLFAACGRAGQNNLEFVEAAPDADALTLDEDGSQIEIGGAARQATVPESSIARTVQASAKQVNEAIRQVLGHIAAMIKTEPDTTRDGARVWTADKNGLSYRLTVHRIALGTFGWKVDVKKATDDDDAYVGVMRGRIRRGARLAARRGAGSLGIDLTTYYNVAQGTEAAITKQGHIFAAFAHSATGAHLRFRLKDFVTDTAQTDVEPISVYFSGFRLFEQQIGDRTVPAMGAVRAGGRVNVAQFDDLAGSANETVTARLRRVVGFGGWGRAIIRGGDMPIDTRRIVRECWRAPDNGNEGLYLRQVWDCTGTFDRAAGTYPACTLRSSYPAEATADDAPESTVTREGFRARCFGDVADSLRDRLKELAANDPTLPEDPAEADENDERPVATDIEQTTESVATDDANAIDSAMSLSSFE